MPAARSLAEPAGRTGASSPSFSVVALVRNYDLLMAAVSAIERGWQALHRWSWLEARLAFEEALTDEESPEGLEGLGAAASWLDEGALAIDARARAYRLFRERDDAEGAARTAAAIADAVLTFHGDAAVASGWLQRARNVLADRPESPVLAWIDGLEAFLAVAYEKDVARAIGLGETALARSRSLGDLDSEMVALAILGVAKSHGRSVCGGNARARRGDGRGSLGRDQRSRGFCDRVLRAGDGERARARPRTALAVVSVRDEGRARLQQPCALQLPAHGARRGPHLVGALAGSGGRAAGRDRGHGRTPLARRFRDAPSRRAPPPAGTLRRGGWAPTQAARADERRRHGARYWGGRGRSRARSRRSGGRGNTRGAISPSYPRERPGRATRRPGSPGPARVALGDTERATEAASELAAVAEVIPTGPVCAAARLASGLVAASRGDKASAIGALEEAIELYEVSGASFDVARVRIAYARVLVALGRPQHAVDATEAALAVFESLGSIHEVEIAAELLDALSRASRRPRVDLPPTSREIEVLQLVAKGRSNEEIASMLVLSVRTVERHFSNIYSKIGASGRTARAVATAYAHTHALT